MHFNSILRRKFFRIPQPKNRFAIICLTPCATEVELAFQRHTEFYGQDRSHLQLADSESAGLTDVYLPYRHRLRAQSSTWMVLLPSGPAQKAPRQ
jgi:hypothetical protein